MNRRSLFSRSTWGTLVALLLTAAAHAVPITGSTGPGGIGSLGVAGQGPVMWLDANNIAGAIAGNKVNTWNDVSTNGNNAAADAGSVNTYQLNVRNGNPVVRLPGAVNAREFTAAGISGRTFVAALTVNGTFNCCDGLFGEIGSDGGLRTFNDSSPAWQTTGPIGAGGISVNGTGSASFGAFNSWHAVQAITTGGLASHTSFGIGQYFTTGDRELHGDLGEVAVYSQLLNSAQTQILNSYYGAKYDLAITSDRYAGDTLANGDYDLQVFGVGRVNAGSIYNDADGAGSGTGTGSAGFGIEATSSLDDGEFVLAGHNVATNSIVGLPEGGQRWDRVWYVDETSADGVNATLSFDFSDAGLGAPTPGDQYYLLFSESQAFDFNRLDVVGSLTGDTLSFIVPSSLLVDGYYTLGLNLPPVPEPSTCLLLGLGAAGLVWRVRRQKGTPK